MANEEEPIQDMDDAEDTVHRLDDVSQDSYPDQHAIVSCSTSAGPLVMHFHRAWSPHGYERATSLFERHYYDHSHFFRVVPHFLVQFGIGYTTDAELKHFSQSTIPDDPKRTDVLPFKEGRMSFAGSGPNSRSSQLFIAYDRAQSLGTSPWETPFGELVGDSSFETARRFYQGYGDMPPWGKGPKQGLIHSRGRNYIEEEFPKLDAFLTCTVQRVQQLPTEGVGTSSSSSSEEEGNGVIGGHVRKVHVEEDGVQMEQPPRMKIRMPLVIVALLVLWGVVIRRKKKRKETKRV